MAEDLKPRFVTKIVSGGQTGADRGALNAAISAGVPYGGWCPQGGWAEDLTEPPGLIAEFPNLSETPLRNPEQRTEWNVRDSDATIILRPHSSKSSEGTDFTQRIALQLGRPYLELDPTTNESLQFAQDFLNSLNMPLTLNVAGPRESQSPGIEEIAERFVLNLIDS